MAVIGLSLILASVVYLIICPPPWLASYLISWRQPGIEGPMPPTVTVDNVDDKDPERESDEDGVDGTIAAEKVADDKKGSSPCLPAVMEPQTMTGVDTNTSVVLAAQERMTKPSPPPPSIVASPSISSPDRKIQTSATIAPQAVISPPSTSLLAVDSVEDQISMPPPPRPQPRPPRATSLQSDEQATPRAGPSTLTTRVPSFNLETPSSLSTPSTSFSAATNTLMPPPSRSARPQTLSPGPFRGAHLSTRGPGTSTLAPSSTHTSIPTKSRQVTLQPGRSPLDWARISSSPAADLRNLLPGTPYLKVTRAQLKSMNGRRGNDAWMALNGKVYNIEPYREYHPGGVGELLRSAGKDGTRLFGEVHPWVNYETMLQACLVGVLVEDHEVKGSMEEMD